MKFNLLGRDVEVGWKQLALYLTLYALLFFIALVIIIAYSFYLSSAQGIDIFSANIAASSAFSGFISFLQPSYNQVLRIFTAFALLAISGYFGMKKDVALCRTFAACEFIIFGIVKALLGILGYLFLIVVVKVPANGNPFTNFADTVIGSAFSSIMLYFWLLILFDPQKAKLRKAALGAAAFAIGFFLLLELYNFLVSYTAGNIYSPTYRISGILLLFLYSFLLALPILYHAYGRKIDQDAYVFAVVYLIQNAFHAVLDFLIAAAGGPALASYFGAALKQLSMVGLGVLQLIAFYLLAMMWKNRK